MADGEKSKLIIDEDWKSQVQAEKERFAKEQVKSTPAPSEQELPPATLAVLVQTLVTQALVGLGVIANPLTGKAELHLGQAKHFIDTLQMLEDKTVNNRTADESALFGQVLPELRLAYVTVSNSVNT